MKVKLSDDLLSDDFNSLYPTWFRWKFCQHTSSQVPLSALYPTWFRWKWDISNAYIRNPKLYIPHGSDERVSEVNYVDSKTNPLYPTWFRWKGKSRYMTITAPDFISHMVQMKVYSFCHSMLNHLTALYPTWFRWKKPISKRTPRTNYSFISHMVQMKDSPHRSAWSLQASFISHMVQMKVAPIARHEACKPPLYPTWFRWKPLIRS